MNIDWTDKRAIGLKYKFLNNDKVFNVESVKVYKGILYIDNIGAGRVGTNDWTKTIQLVQGDKTPYDGESENPLPGNVNVKVLLKDKGNSIVLIRRSQDVEWQYVVEYQVQEMSEETRPSQDLVDDQQDLFAEFAKVIDDYLLDLTEVTVPIKQSTIDDIVECLEDYKHIALILNGVMTGVGAKFDSTEYERAPIQVDKLIKELKG